MGNYSWEERVEIAENEYKKYKIGDPVYMKGQWVTAAKKALDEKNKKLEEL